MARHWWTGRKCSHSGKYIKNTITTIKKIYIIISRFSHRAQFELGGTMHPPKPAAVSVMDLGKMLLHCSREGEAAKVKELMGRGAPFTTDWVNSKVFLHRESINQLITPSATYIDAYI